MKVTAMQMKREIYHAGISRDLDNFHEQPPIILEGARQ
jgi:hypothetical protein